MLNIHPSVVTHMEFWMASGRNISVIYPMFLFYGCVRVINQFLWELCCRNGHISVCKDDFSSGEEIIPVMCMS